MCSSPGPPPFIVARSFTTHFTNYNTPANVRFGLDKSPGSSQLLNYLTSQAMIPEYQVRFKWRRNSVAFWDNRSTAHLAPRDIYDSDFDRQFYRVTLVGDVPVGVDGKPSTALEGVPITAV